MGAKVTICVYFLTDKDSRKWAKHHLLKSRDWSKYRTLSSLMTRFKNRQKFGVPGSRRCIKLSILDLFWYQVDHLSPWRKSTSWSHIVLNAILDISFQIKVNFVSAETALYNSFQNCTMHFILPWIIYDSYHLFLYVDPVFKIPLSFFRKGNKLAYTSRLYIT